MFVFHLEADLEPRTAAAGMACGAASPAAVFPEAVAGVASPRMNVAKSFLAAAMTRRSDSATRQPMASSATRSRFRAAGRFWMISRRSSMASMVFAMYSMCRCMRPTPLLMFTSDSRSDDGRERYGRPPAEIGAAAGDRAMGKEHPE